MPDPIPMRRHGVRAAVMTFEPERPLPDGPFVVTISDRDGKMFEVVFPDAGGVLPPDHPIMATSWGDAMGAQHFIVNLLTGALQALAGRVVRS